MKNLAGDMNCDGQIESELREAGIDIVRHDKRLPDEVPASITGELQIPGVTFKRAWYYWVVSGRIPITLANQMYAVESRRDVRVAGHCGSPPPDQWARPSEKDIRRMCTEQGLDYEMFKDSRTVDSYHIDTQEGLNFFVICVKKWFGVKG